MAVFARDSLGAILTAPLPKMHKVNSMVNWNLISFPATDCFVDFGFSPGWPFETELGAGSGAVIGRIDRAADECKFLNSK